MKLLLIRHAHALDGLDDDARPLSDRGVKSLARVVRGLGRLGLEVDHLVHSPKVRAVQTADAVAALLRAEGSTAVHDGLAEAPGNALLVHLRGQDGTVAVVGHEPHLTSLLAWLVAGRPSEDGCVELKKGGVAVLEGEPRPGGMRLMLLATPALLRRLT